jgi:hypothetical protein
LPGKLETQYEIAKKKFMLRLRLRFYALVATAAFALRILPLRHAGHAGQGPAHALHAGRPEGLLRVRIAE